MEVQCEVVYMRESERERERDEVGEEIYIYG